MQYKVIRLKTPTQKLERDFYTRLNQLAYSQSITMFRLNRPMVDMLNDLCREAMTWTNKGNKLGHCELACYGDEHEVIIHRLNKPGDILYKVIQIAGGNE